MDYESFIYGLITGAGGGIMTSKHPKRCETCGKLWKPSCPYYAWIEKGNIGISCDSYIEFTAIVGCASHSSATECPAQAVLDSAIAVWERNRGAILMAAAGNNSRRTVR
jgi:hypothetical protein